MWLPPMRRAFFHLVLLSTVFAFLFRPLTTSSRSFLQSSNVKSTPVIPQGQKLGVLFLNLGGPENLEDVEGFLYNLFADPDIIKLPAPLSILQSAIALYISKTRLTQSKNAYASIGGGSPIVKYTTEQCRLIEAGLKDKGYDAKCYFAMRYWKPFTETVLDEIYRDEIDTLVIMPLYPHFSLSTSGSSLKLLSKLFRKDSTKWSRLNHTVVTSWYHRPGYVQSMARLILTEISKFPREAQENGIDVLFSAHGVPQSYIDLGDPYQQHIEECVLMVSREVTAAIEENKYPNLGALPSPNKLKFHLSFQSRVGPVPWLKPYTDEAIKNLGKAGVKNLAVVPVAFVSEHIETLEEIDGEYRELAKEEGIVNWRRVPAMNTDEKFIADITEQVEDSLKEPIVSVHDACVSRLGRDQEVEARNALNQSPKSSFLEFIGNAFK